MGTTWLTRWKRCWVHAAAWGSFVLTVACSSGSPGKSSVPESAGSGASTSNPATGGNANGGTDPGLMLGCDPNAAAGACPTTMTNDTCGDGILTPGEACDDANTQSGDGCRADCQQSEPGYACSPPGSPCQELVICGDSILSPSEQCDDGNAKDGDGCSAHCLFETGYKCSGSPSTCTATQCGDGHQEGAETCDDGNTEPFDGCSASCQAEPVCTGSGCTSRCGDGLLIDEACDDGNTNDGDGCSHTCVVERGFACSHSQPCEKINGSCVLRLTALFRDFSHTHSDFEQPGCGSQTAVTGIVQPELSKAGKPLLAANGPKACIASANSFAEWYTDTENNRAIASELVLFDDGKGNFVNRWGTKGEQWTAGGTALDGTPFFFPIDGNPKALPDTLYDAATGPPYASDFSWESALVPGAGQHNFHFTTEVKYWFVFDAMKSATLAFTGDDDVWVFVNGKLALDLGGLHPPASDSLVLDAASAADYGLQDGKVYAISIFHAERHTEGSSFRLTLRGFNAARSLCASTCGDGIVSAGEQCDDGVNDGGYGQCGPGCKLGDYCGDGVMQGSEECDDGNRLNADGCSSSCRTEILK